MTLARLVFVFIEFQEGRDGSVNVFELLFVTIYAYNPVIHALPATSDSRLSNLHTYLRVTGNHPRPIPTSKLHNSLNTQPISVLIHCLTDKFFAYCHLQPNPLVRQIGNYTLADLTNLYKKYNHELRSVYCCN
jgi:hypothetical protein